MSELTRCNYCTLQAIKRDNTGKKVEVKPTSDPGMAGRIAAIGKE